MTESARNLDSECTAQDPERLTLSTRELASAEGRTRWEEALDAAYCEMGVRWPRAEAGFQADIDARPLGELAISVVRAEPHAVVRTPATIDSDANDDFLLCLIAEGAATAEQDGRVAVLDSGAAALLDSSRPFVVTGDAVFEQVVLRIPRDQFSPLVTESVVDNVVGQRISADSGIGRLVSGFLVDVAGQRDLTDESGRSVSSAALDLVAAAVTQGAGSLSATAQAHAEDLRTVQQAMLRGIADPDRTLAQVGAELGMSVRYLHKLFASTGSTPRAWLYARRFERAKTLLLQTDQRVADIGEQLGFRDASHFSRAFARHTGQSPRVFRTMRR